LTGYALNRNLVKQLAEEVNGPSVRKVSEIAKDSDMAIIFPYPERDCSSGEIRYYDSIAFISVEYPASLLRGWKTSPRTVNNNTIYQFRFRFVNFCSN